MAILKGLQALDYIRKNPTSAYQIVNPGNLQGRTLSELQSIGGARQPSGNFLTEMAKTIGIEGTYPIRLLGEFGSQVLRQQSGAYNKTPTTEERSAYMNLAPEEQKKYGDIFNYLRAQGSPNAAYFGPTFLTPEELDYASGVQGTGGQLKSLIKGTTTAASYLPGVGLFKTGALAGAGYTPLKDYTPENVLTNAAVGGASSWVLGKGLEAGKNLYKNYKAGGLMDKVKGGVDQYRQTGQVPPTLMDDIGAAGDYIQKDPNLMKKFAGSMDDTIIALDDITAGKVQGVTGGMGDYSSLNPAQMTTPEGKYSLLSPDEAAQLKTPAQRAIAEYGERMRAASIGVEATVKVPNNNLAAKFASDWQNIKEGLKVAGIYKPNFGAAEVFEMSDRMVKAQQNIVQQANAKVNIGKATDLAANKIFQEVDGVVDMGAAKKIANQNLRTLLKNDIETLLAQAQSYAPTNPADAAAIQARAQDMNRMLQMLMTGDVDIPLTDLVRLKNMGSLRELNSTWWSSKIRDVAPTQKAQVGHALSEMIDEVTEALVPASKQYNKYINPVIVHKGGLTNVGLNQTRNLVSASGSSVWPINLQQFQPMFNKYTGLALSESAKNPAALATTLGGGVVGEAIGGPVGMVGGAYLGSKAGGLVGKVGSAMSGLASKASPVLNVLGKAATAAAPIASRVGPNLMGAGTAAYNNLQPKNIDLGGGSFASPERVAEVQGMPIEDLTMSLYPEYAQQIASQYQQPSNAEMLQGLLSQGYSVSEAIAMLKYLYPEQKQTDYQRKLAGASQAAQQALQLLQSGGVNTGLLGGRVEDVSGTLGMQSQQNVNYRSSLALARTLVRTALLGSQMSPAELESIMAFIPEFYDSPDQAQTKLTNFISLLNQLGSAGDSTESILVPEDNYDLLTMQQ